mgnify:CR=1 FL=1
MQSRKPEQLARKSLKLFERELFGHRGRAEQFQKAGPLLRIHRGCEQGKIEAPADPHHSGAEAGLVPTHRHAQDEEQYHQERGPERGGAGVQKAEQIVHVHEQGMIYLEQAVAESDQEPGHPAPVKTGSTGAEIQSQTLIQKASVMKTEQAAVLRADEDSPVSLGHIKNQGRNRAGRVTQRHAGLHIVDGRVTGLIGKLRVLGHSGNRAINHKPVGTAPSTDQTQLPNCAALVSAAQKVHIARNELDPPSGQLFLEQSVDSLRGRQSRLPGRGATVIEHSDPCFEHHTTSKGFQWAVQNLPASPLRTSHNIQRVPEGSSKFTR